MQLLSMYLALLFGTILATTVAARGGLKKDHIDLVDLRPSPVHELEGHVGSSSSSELTCNILEAFDNMGRDENNAAGGGLDWSTLCDDFEPLEELLCPLAFDTICSENKPFGNPAAKKNWCTPIFADIGNALRRAECIRFCTNYVSAARGDCCGISNACGGGVC
jgi:hypothetical protein